MDHLIVLDLNGVLIQRRDKPIKDLKPDVVLKIKHNRFIYFRPHVKDFLNWLLQHYNVGIWTSAKEQTICEVIPKLFGNKLMSKLKFILYQDNCIIDYNSKINEKPIIAKPIIKIKEYMNIDIKNILIIDDSNDKMILNNKNNYIIVKSWNAEDIFDRYLGPHDEFREFLKDLKEHKDVYSFLSNKKSNYTDDKIGREIFI